MKSQKFGVELECTGITREAASRVAGSFFGTTPVYVGGGYQTYEVRDQQSRTWKFVYDSSIKAENRNGSFAGNDYKVEMVSPILRYEDIELLQELIRNLKKAGAKVNDSCGIHIHVDGANHTAKSLRNLMNIGLAKEDLIFQALNINAYRRMNYAKPLRVGVVNEANRVKTSSVDQLANIWYEGNVSGRFQHYNDTRYSWLNLHNFWYRGTCEFRLFNATLHAGKMKSYIQFCLAVSHQAINQSSANAKRTQTTNPAYTFRTWLLRLGLIGDEFKTARLHLLANLEGNKAWRSGRPA